MSTTIAKKGDEVSIKPSGKGKRAWKLSVVAYNEVVRAAKIFEAEEKKGATAITIDGDIISITKPLVEDKAEPAKK